MIRSGANSLFSPRFVAILLTSQGVTSRNNKNSCGDTKVDSLFQRFHFLFVHNFTTSKSHLSKEPFIMQTNSVTDYIST